MDKPIFDLLYESDTDDWLVHIDDQEHLILLPWHSLEVPSKDLPEFVRRANAMDIRVELTVESEVVDA